MPVELTRPSREFVDVDFMFSKNPISNNLSIKKTTNAIKQSILHLLTLKEGEKPFHREIHSPIYGYLFENASIVTKIVLEGEIRKYLESYDPRVIVETVDVSFENVNAISVNLECKLINTAEPFTINLLVDRLR